MSDANALKKEYRWFRNQGFRSKDAIQYAKAQLLLKRAWMEDLLEVEWEDDCPFEGPREWGWEEKDVKKWYEQDHECYGCVLKIGGEVEDSLWGIFDPTDSYRKIVETEMIQNYLHRNQGLLPTPF